jgi:hypothetical protein
MEEIGSLVARAHAALARVDDGRGRELEQAWRHRPWSIGISGGNGAARAALLNLLCGDKVVDPYDRSPNSPSLRVRRGPRFRYQITHADGRVEDNAAADTGPDLPAIATRLDDARGALAARERTLAIAEHAVPAAMRRRLVWWQIWHWLVRWLLGWRIRARVDDLQKAQGAVEEARRDLTRIEQDAAVAEQQAAQRRAHFHESLRAAALVAGVREIAIEVVDGPLPEDVEVVEIAGATRAASDVDAIVVIEQDEIVAHASDGNSVSIGTLPTAIATLPALAAHARAVKLVRRASDLLAASVRSDGAELARAEARFQARFAQIDALRIADPDAFAQAHRLQLRPHIVGSIHAVMEHAAVHLGQELAELGQGWNDAIAATTDSDQLGAALESIELSSPQETQRIAGEVSLLVGNGLAGAAYDLLPELVAALRPYGLPEPTGKPPRFPVATVEILPALAGKQSKLGGARAWLAGLFRSFETRKAEVSAKAGGWLDHVRELAQAELLDAEPRMHAAVAEAIGDQLGKLMARQAEWLAGEQAAARDAVRAERTSLEPIVARRDTAQRDRDELAAALARMEAEQPAAAAAASAAVAA